MIDIATAPSIAAALKGVGVVISWIDQPGRTLLWAAIERGLNYTDITPHLTKLGRGAAYDKIDAAARVSGARVVLGTGIVPSAKHKSAQITSIAGPLKSSIGNAPLRRLPLSD
jgi:saccharopine dehydrogenase-like NADP-dependent oxidoreductase